MKLMIASDLHGSAYYTHQLLDAWDREGAPRLFLLGDILYHGPRNDLPEGYAPKEVLAMLNERKDRIFCVRGNCDGEVDQMVLDFPIMADYAVLTEGERLIYATHGHVYNTAHLPPLQPGGFYQAGFDGISQTVLGGLINNLKRLYGLHARKRPASSTGSGKAQRKGGLALAGVALYYGYFPKGDIRLP